MSITYVAPSITITDGITSGTATAGASTSLTDSSKSWISNAYAGRQIRIVSGTGAGQIRRISSNAAAYLTIYMPWSVNPTSNSVYVVSYNLSDVKAADTAGGWGVVAQQSTTQYFLTCNLLIGNGTVKTFLADEKIDLRFDYAASRYFVVRASATFCLGSQDTYGRSQFGCSLYVRPISDTVDIAGDLFAFSSKIISEGVSWDGYARWNLSAGSYNFYDCDLELGDGINIPAGSPTFTIQNCRQHHSGSVGLKLHKIPTLVSDLILASNQYGLQVYYGNAVICKNLTFLSNVSDIIMNGSYVDTLTLVNPSPSQPSIDAFLGSSKTVNLKSEYDLNVKDGAAANVATVKIGVYNNAGSNVVLTTTDASGNIATQQILYADAINSTSYTARGPHTMRLRKYGAVFQDFKKSFISKLIDAMVVSANSVITQANSATVAAYTGITVNHGTATLTIGANHTMAEVYDYTQYNATLDASMGYAEWLTSVDGVSFASKYSVVVNDGYTLSGAGKRLSLATGKSLTLYGTGNVDFPVSSDAGTRVPVSVQLITPGGSAVGATVRIERADNYATLLEGQIASGNTYRSALVIASDLAVNQIVRHASGSPAYSPVSRSETVRTAVGLASIIELQVN